ncbi:MAG TPA: glycosyltransferase family 10, partial [Lacibacter sp.]|nr:glycosyltransferase family 10 [Lacibacter sp.]
KYLNNVGGPVADKRAFIKDYKFVLSFENSTYPGYTTEKLIEPMLVNSIPIYWGNERVGEDFNTRSFVHVNQFASYEEAIEYIIELDKDEDQYLQMAMQPWFPDNQIPASMTQESLEAFFDFVLEDMNTQPPVAASFVKANWHKLQLVKQQIEDKVYGRLGINRGFR